MLVHFKTGSSKMPAGRATSHTFDHHLVCVLCTIFLGSGVKNPVHLSSSGNEVGGQISDIKFRHLR